MERKISLEVCGWSRALTHDLRRWVINPNHYSIGSDEDIFPVSICKYFLTHQFKHVFWELKRTVSLRRSFEYPQHMFWLRNEKNNFQLLVHMSHILIRRPVRLIIHLLTDSHFFLCSVNCDLRELTFL